ncbi:group II intron reverse transcriptase/maturase [Serpentinicella alkaliphila]|uniref:Group II intron reverse transcriptase/maturase n=1 Tax=Serpentinicella alkaliphila TaxID=1734049 RepID=A0A4V2T147_9FIRM|nr:group II intron reverse transcriptase/maturase [Serpentinicella alkaliphila]QUH26060.1 group II intron reverse transcriptase/maturase [Serpentinicella alkaliphila]TCP92153.1 group II intron reverse transcriptase/maturase [Serpentinicella alkaliphila]
MSTKLDGIAIKAKHDKKAVFTSLAHIITPDFLKETWKMMNRKGARGIDGETTKEFESKLDERVQDVCTRMKENRYKAPPVKRVDIPKGDGKTRPLGIPTVGDRLVQRAVARILEAIYEPEFMDFSYGFRPKRNPHQALRELRNCIVKKKVRFVYEADIKGYFNHINHAWLMKMLRLKVKDPVILNMIGKWLRAGVMINGIVIINGEGTPQGGPISPILANIYLHYVLDLWYQKKFKTYAQGEVYLVRFADDYVACFQYKRDAEKFEKYSKYRINKFGLQLADEKTRLMLFGRYARERKAMYDEKPEAFDFLGFKHICGVGNNGQFALIRKPTTKSCRKFLDKTHKWLKAHSHWKRRDQQRQLTSMLRGFYQYFSLHHCGNKLSYIRSEVVNQWIRSLRRRSQRHRMYWSYLKKSEWFKLPYPELIHADI